MLHARTDTLVEPVHGVEVPFQLDISSCRSAWVLVGLESGSLGALSASTASGQLLQGVGNVGALNMLPYEGEAPPVHVMHPACTWSETRIWPQMHVHRQHAL